MAALPQCCSRFIHITQRFSFRLSNVGLDTLKVYAKAHGAKVRKFPGLGNTPVHS